MLFAIEIFVNKVDSPVMFVFLVCEGFMDFTFKIIWTLLECFLVKKSLYKMIVLNLQELNE